MPEVSSASLSRLMSLSSSSLSSQCSMIAFSGLDCIDFCGPPPVLPFRLVYTSSSSINACTSRFAAKRDDWRRAFFDGRCLDEDADEETDARFCWPLRATTALRYAESTWVSRLSLNWALWGQDEKHLPARCGSWAFLFMIHSRFQ